MDGRRQRSERTRSLVLEAAMRLVATEGLSELTQRRVAASAGVALASVTYHYPTLADLRIATMAAAAERLENDIRGLRDEVVAERLALVDACMAIVDAELDGPDHAFTVMTEARLAAARDPGARAIVAGVTGHAEQLFHGHVAQPGSEQALSDAFSGVMLRAIASGADADRAKLRRSLEQICTAFGVHGRAPAGEDQAVGGQRGFAPDHD